MTFYICHCRDCQRQSSSAFGMSLWVAPENFELVAGKLEFWQTAGDSGAAKICAFCGDCGSRIYHACDDPSAPVSIKAGTLDDLTGLAPVAELWTRRAHPWARVASDNCLAFDGEPDSDERLLARWREARSGPS
ncbi:MAG: GFA family protein [Gammaproteobacteria bacterium]